MKKRFYLQNGKEVHFGDEIRTERIKETELGIVTRVTVIMVTEDNIDKLIERGIITVKEDKKYECVENINDCLNLIAKKAKMPSSEVFNLCDTLLKIYPVATLSILLRTIALDFEKKYKGKISDCPEVYCFGTISGKIYKIATSKVTNWGHFAAFRTAEDAKIAMKICQPILNMMYGEQKDKKCKS